MTEAQEPKKEEIIKITATKTFKVGSKLVAIGGLIILMLIPLLLVTNIISERESYKVQALNEISAAWAKNQTIVGPFLSVPFKLDKKSTQTETLNISPEKIDISAKVYPEIRYKGIFKYPVYSTDIVIKGTYSTQNISSVGIYTINPKLIEWNKAHVFLNIADLKGITGTPVIKLQNQSIPFIPGTIEYNQRTPNIVAMSNIKPTKDIPFEVNIKLNGSDSIKFLPIGKDNKINVQSSWSNPSFIGNFLPVAKTITDKGFDATWDISYLATSFPQAWVNNTNNLGSVVDQSSFGASLLIPVDTYRNTLRAVKYGILFIVLTFTVCFMFELVGQVRIHPFQYILVGMALMIFYILLLSIAEFIDFNYAYIIASFAVIAMITIYTHFVLTKKLRKTYSIAMFLTLIALYAYLYVLLQLQDMSLLLGSIGLFIALGVIMYATRNVKWYDTEIEKSK